MLVFLMILHFLKLTTLSCFVLSALLSFLYLMLFLIACSLLWFHLVITILLSLMIRAPLKMLLLNTLSPLSVFPNVANGCAAKLYFPWIPQVIFYLPIFFSITDMLLNICCTLGRLIPDSALIFPNYEMILFI